MRLFLLLLLLFRRGGGGGERNVLSCDLEDQSHHITDTDAGLILDFQRGLVHPQEDQQMYLNIKEGNVGNGLVHLHNLFRSESIHALSLRGFGLDVVLQITI